MPIHFFDKPPDKKEILTFLLVTIGFPVAGWTGFLLATPSTLISPFWPPAGLALAAMLLFGKRILPAIFFGSLILTFSLLPWRHGWSLSIVLFALFDALVASAQAWIGYSVLKQLNIDKGFLSSVKNTFTFFGLALALGFITSLPGATLFLVFGLLEGNLFLNGWLTWWLGDIIGLWVITPFMLAFYENRKLDFSLGGFLEVISVFTLTVALIFLIFGPMIAEEFISVLPFLTMIVLLWISFRFTPRETAAAVVGLAAMAVLATMSGYGPFMRPDRQLALTHTQFFVGIAALVGYSMAVAIQERRRAVGELKDIQNDLEKRVNKRTLELATINKELLVEVNQRKKAEAALKESEERNKAMLMSIPDLIFLHNRDGKYLDYQAAEKNTASPESGFLGKTVDDVLPADVADEMKTLFARSLASGETCTMEYSLNVTGKIRHFEARISECGEERVMRIVRDISEKKTAEKALQESEDRLRFIFENAQDVIFSLSPEATFADLSPAVEQASGYKTEELRHQPFMTIVAPEDRDKVSASLKRVLEGSENEIGLEYKVNHKNGHPAWHATSVSRNQNSSGELRFVGVAKDITERILAEKERRKLEEQIRHSQKLESLGVLAGGIAHDFNNLLTAIMGNCGLAIMQIPDEGKSLRKNLANIEKASTRAADLCRQLLAYSGKGQFIVEAINLNDMVEDMTHLLEVSLSKKVELQYDFDESLPALEADAAQIQQVIMNLITNASEAIGDRRGRIAVRTKTMFCDRQYLNTTLHEENLPEGHYMYLEVEDNGSGMDQETVERIFDPFFTTKFTGRGLGLAAVLGIVRSHRGAIDLETSVNNGTRFRILFPVKEQTEQESLLHSKNGDAAAMKDWRGSGTVMVVDDDEAIRQLGKTTLEGAGLNVITADDGRDAVRVFEENHEEIHLVLMDMTMPHLNGREAFQELKRIREDVKVILSSGYSEQEATRRFKGDGLCGFLQKPYKPHDLINKVQPFLEQAV